jgi:putative inorganic carbon (hco3(-)) transporter
MIRQLTKWPRNNRPFYILFTFLAVASAIATAQYGLEAFVLTILLAISIPMLVYSTTHLHVGLYITFFASFFILGLLRFFEGPGGLVMDFLILFYLLVMVVHIGRGGSWSFANNAVGMAVLVWIVYNLAQVANPFAESRLAWVYSVRGMAGILLFFYFCLYAIQSGQVVKTFVHLWIFLALLLAGYGLYQEFVGLQPFEIEWIKKDPIRYSLFYNWGRYRKFSFFSDPTTFGITVAYSALLCFVLSLGPANIFWRIFYLLAGGIMAISMVFSGTRTAYVLIPAGIFFLAVLTLNSKILFFSFLFFVAGAGVILSPIQSLGPLDANALERLRSAFMPENDPSFNVRLKNQLFIKPYIQSHPIGAGLGSVGDWGKRFSPGSALANFPPDSGFVKIAVELGWVGMIIYCTMLFLLFKIGVKNYHQLSNPALKNIQASLLCVLFCLIIANYAQEAITMYPTSILFYASMAMVVLMPKIEKNEK